MKIDNLISDFIRTVERLGMKSAKNIAGFSSGKDSDCLALLAKEAGFDMSNFQLVGCDTDNEHKLTIQRLREFHHLMPDFGPVQILKRTYEESDFARKRSTIDKKWRDWHIKQKKRNGDPVRIILPPVPEAQIQAALAVMHPTGNSFWDMCLLHGCFPSRIVQFCTEELKTDLVMNQVILPALDAAEDEVFWWSGVRRAESIKRANTPLLHDDPKHPDLQRFNPLINWKIEHVVEMHRRHGLQPNPLYFMGYTKVGCMECINANKSNIAQTSLRNPEYLEMLGELEKLVAKVCRDAIQTGYQPSFFGPNLIAPKRTVDARGNKTIVPSGHIPIRQVMDWAMTDRTKHYDILLAAQDNSRCTSPFFKCE